MLFLAYLSRRRNTYRLRLLLLPAVIGSLVSWPYQHTWVSTPELRDLLVQDWGISLMVVAFIAKSLHLALDPNGTLKVGEDSEAQLPASGLLEPSVRKHDKKTRQHLPLVPDAVYDACEVAISQRGIGYKFGAGTYIPPHTKPLERKPFLRATFLSLLRNLFILDALDTALRIIPGLLQGEGDSTLFNAALPPLPRYALSTSITLLTVWHMFTGFTVGYDMSALFCVGALGSSPSSWPPVLQNPVKSDSLHKFWARSWHQWLRQAFYVYGGYSGKWLAGTPGMVVGMFAASALVHECSVNMTGLPWEWYPVGFFMMQPVFLGMEKLYTKITGKRVGGWKGGVWAYGCLALTSQAYGGLSAVLRFSG